MKKISISLLFGLMSLVGFSQVGLVENFDAGVILPAGWTTDGGDYAVSFVENCAGRSVRVNLDNTNTDAHLTSPNFVGESNGTDLTIAFDYKIVDWAAAVDATPPGWGDLMIQYSTNDGAIWNTVETIDDGNHVTANTCANFSTVIPAASLPIGTDFKLRINANWAAGTYYVYLDNISATQVVVGPPSCANLLTPTNGSTGVSINTDLEWSTATNIPTGYTVIVGTTPGGTDIADNIDAGLSTTYDLPVLEYSTTYYVTIIPYNGNGPAVDCPEWSFVTGADPNAPVDCAAGTPINTVYCYENNETITWNFESSDGSPLNVFFNAGQFETCCDDIFIYNGSDNTAPLLFGDGLADMTGQSFVATSGFLYIEIQSDGSVSCTANAFIPLDFDVSCVDATAVPNCNSDLTTPANGAVDVDITTGLVWTPASIIVDGYFLSVGTLPGGTDIVDNEDVGNVLTYDFASLLEYETTYCLTITPYNSNGNAVGCTEYCFTTEVNPYPCDAADQCAYTFILTDTFGDGWNGNTMSVLIDGNEVELLGEDFTGGTGPIEVDVLLCDGFPFELYWNAGGAFAGEVGVSIIDPFDDEIYNMAPGTETQDSSLFTTVANCTPPTCPRPRDIVIGTINMNDVEISWTEIGTADTWEVIVQPLGTGYPDGTEPEIIQTTDNPFVYPGLDSGTQYEIYVRAICAVDDLSDWEGPAAFDTTLCDSVDQCLYTFIMTDTFGDGWNGNTMNVLQNGIVVGVFGDEFTGGTGPIEVEIALCEGIPFELYWNAGGAFAGEVGVSIVDPFDEDIYTMAPGTETQDSSLFTDVVNCTPPTCPRPIDIVLGEITPTSVEISWTETGTADTWEVIVQPVGTGYPDGTEPEIVQTTDNPYVYTGLTSGVEYEIYVRSICAVDDISDWRGPQEFATPVLVDCDLGTINNTFCYDNGAGTFIQIFSFLSTGGFPLNIEFNGGDLGFGDSIRIEDADGVILYEGNNGGDLSGLTLMTTSETLILFIQADGFGSCVSSGTAPLDFDIWCQTCVPQTVSFDVVNGDCDTDPDNPIYEVQVNITDMGGAASIIITDDQGSTPVTVTETGPVIFGPYPASTIVILQAENVDDLNCINESNPLSFICPPPPNPCSIVFAGDDQSVDCDNPDAELSGSFHLYGNDTTNYDLNATDICPSPPVDGATPTSINSDDVWSEVIDLGFDFCFFDGVYNQVLVGSNGVISFELENANTGNGWAFDPGDTLPNTTNASITEGNIFGVGHDIDPSVCGSIDYVVLGSAPYRQFVVNFNDVCHFSCNDIRSTSQIVLYESSNNIEVHVLEKPICPGWNDGGLAVIGLQSVDDTQAVTPPGRNMGIWEVTPDAPESWRFSPTGTPLYNLEWIDEDGNVVGTDPTINVAPTRTTTYTLEITYDLCTGGQASVSDDVTIEVITDGTGDASFTVDPTCDGATATVTGDLGGVFEFNPEPGDGAMIDPDTGTVTNAIPFQSYTVQYVVDGTGDCPIIESVTFTPQLPDDSSFTLSPACDGGTATVTGIPGGTFAFNPDPGDGAVIDPDTGTVSGGMPGASYIIEYTSNGDCPSTTSETLNTLLDGGAFVEDFGTGTDREATPYTTYTFNGVTQVNDGEYAINNNASDLNTGWHDMEDHTAGDTDGLMFVVNASAVSGEFYRRTINVTSDTEYNFSSWITTVYDTDTFICPGTGVPSNVTFRIEDALGTLITEINTGDIQNEANPNWQEYQLNFNTLTNTEVQLVLSNQGASGCGNDLAIDDISLTPVEPVLSFVADCEGGTTTVTGASGGTFILNPDPGDGAVIDSSTGIISGGTAGAMYTIEYTIVGGCVTTSLDVTLLPAEDASFTMTPTCDGGTATITGDTGGAFALNPDPGDGASIDTSTGTVSGGSTGTNYTVEYTTGGTCPATSSITFTSLPDDDSSFTMIPTCDGATATITGVAGGTFAFNPAPGDGAMIDASTGTVTGGMPDTSYTVDYTSADVCPSTSTETFTVLPADDASFTLTANCDSATVTIMGETGGTFAFNPDPGDGASINSSTGTITDGVAGSTYNVEYTTNGACPDSSIESVTLLTNVFDFNIVGDCNGSVFELTITPIGDSYNPDTASYVLYDDMNSLLLTNAIGDNVFEISPGIFTPPMAGSTYNYMVEVTNSEGCIETNTVLVESINCIIPQAISPNDDDYNDNFDLSGFNVSRLEIYNRHGIKVYSKTNYTNEWYGQTDEGKELPVGTYFYVMEYQGNKTKSSWVYINK